MAGKHRWKIEATSRATAALTQLQQTMQREEKIVKLSEQEKEVWHYMLRSYPDRGRPAYAEEVQAHLALEDADAADKAIARLNELDLLTLEGGLVAALYPYSVNPTLHEIHFPEKEEWQPVYAACSIDALGVSSIVDEAVNVESRCAFCDAVIHVGLQSGDIREASPDSMKLWISGRYDAHASTSLCEATVFACSDQHLAAWRGKSGEKEGFAVTLGESLHVARRLFEGVLTTV